MSKNKNNKTNKKKARKKEKENYRLWSAFHSGEITI